MRTMTGGRCGKSGMQYQEQVNCVKDAALLVTRFSVRLWERNLRWRQRSHCGRLQVCRQCLKGRGEQLCSDIACLQITKHGLRTTAVGSLSPISAVAMNRCSGVRQP